MKANTLVRYHGSKALFSGLVMRVLGRCGCLRCVRYGDVRWRLAFRGEDTCQLHCVRGQSFTAVTINEADANPFTEYLPDLGSSI